MTPTPVGHAGAAFGLSVDRVPQVNSDDFLARLRVLNLHFLLVVSFGQMLKEPLLSLPSFGCINIHASLLPRYRGASPIAAAIRGGETSTGVSFMKMDRGLDTGPVYERISVDLTGTERTDRLELLLGEKAADAVVPILQGIYCGHLHPEEQEHARATYCAKLSRADGWIDWRCSAEEIEAQIRAYSPWPGTRFRLRVGGRSFPVTVGAAAVRSDLAGVPGEILRRDKCGWIIGCGEDALELKTVSVPGGRAMAATAFLNGLRGDEMSLCMEQ